MANRRESNALLTTLISGNRDNIVLSIEPLQTLLEDLSVDAATFFGRYSYTQIQVAELVRKQHEGTGVHNELDAYRGLFLLFAEAIELSARYGGGGAAPNAEEVGRLNAILQANEHIIAVLKKCFDFGTGSGDTGLVASLDWETLRVHRVGTTSIIFTLVDRISGGGAKYVLKLSHVLFTTIGPIADATIDYHESWRKAGAQCKYLVRVVASGIGWILEDYLPGETLQEFVDRRMAADSSRTARLSVLIEVLPPLLAATQDMHSKVGIGHGDLNPSNILIQTRSESDHSRGPELNPDMRGIVPRFIDMGRNLLASDEIGRVRSAETAFVAPEVRELAPSSVHVTSISDLFSLGHLIATLLGLKGSQGFFGLPEELFSEFPTIAPFAATLADGDVQRRQRRFDEVPLDVFNQNVSNAATLLRMVEVDDASSVRSWFAQGLESVHGSWTPVTSSLRRVWVELRQSQKRDEVSSVIPTIRILLSGIFVLLGFLVCLQSFLVENHLPLAFTNQMVSLGFDPNQVVANWQVRIVGLTFLIACHQYNVRAFGGISFWHSMVSRVLRISSEVLLTTLTFVVFLCIVVSTFVSPTLWVWASSVGLWVVFLNNLCTILIRNRIAGNLNLNVRDREWYVKSGTFMNSRFSVLEYWTPTIFGYSILVSLLALILQLNLAHDRMVYAVAMGAINLLIFSYSQATRQGPLLRTDLAQFETAGYVTRT